MLKVSWALVPFARVLYSSSPIKSNPKIRPPFTAGTHCLRDFSPCYIAAAAIMLSVQPLNIISPVAASREMGGKGAKKEKAGGMEDLEALLTSARSVMLARPD